MWQLIAFSVSMFAKQSVATFYNPLEGYAIQLRKVVLVK
jgi:hypothetical protein